MLLYVCETWFVTEEVTSRLQVFVGGCLRRILRYWWPNTISNYDLMLRCSLQSIASMIATRKWGWIGHTLRKHPQELCKQALDWNPQGKRGRPKTTWRRTVEKEIGSQSKSWSEVKALAANRVRFNHFTGALCSPWSWRNMIMMMIMMSPLSQGFLKENGDK